MCFWTWQSIRISFVKTFRMRSDLLALMTQGQGGLLLCLLLCWLSWEAIRVISVQPLGWLTGRWTEAPRIFRYAEELFQECGHGRWPLYHQIIPADNCLLPLLPGVSTAACVCLLKECVWNHKAQPLFKFPKKSHLGQKRNAHNDVHGDLHPRMPEHY